MVTNIGAKSLALILLRGLVHQQAAVALYIRGAGSGSTAGQIRIKLNIRYGMVSLCVSRTVNLLASMACKYIQWPLKDVRQQQLVARIDEVFGNCIGYIDGSKCQPLVFSNNAHHKVIRNAVEFNCINDPKTNSQCVVALKLLR